MTVVPLYLSGPRWSQRTRWFADTHLGWTPQCYGQVCHPANGTDKSDL